MVPEDDQAMVFPWAAVMVIMVLLNVAFTWATPEAMFLRSRRRTRTASLPILDPFAARRCGLHILAVTFSCRRSPWPAPCGSARWYGSAGREPAIRADAADPGSSRDPSAA